MAARPGNVDVNVVMKLLYWEKALEAEIQHHAGAVEALTKLERFTAY